MTDEPGGEPVEAVDRYPNGNLRFRGTNLDGEMHGDWTFFRADGSVMRSGRFDRGRQVGRGGRSPATARWSRRRTSGTQLTVAGVTLIDETSSVASRPRTSTVRRSPSSSSAPSRPARLRRPRETSSSPAAASDESRAVVFIASPSAVKSEIWSLEPTVPTNATPV